MKALLFDWYNVIDIRGELNDELLEAIEQWRMRYKTGVISTLSRTTYEAVMDPERYGIFDVLQLGGETGYVKPSKHAYLHAAHMLALEPEECVFIDDLAINADGALDAGMKGIVYESNKQLFEELKRIGIV